MEQRDGGCFAIETTRGEQFVVDDVAGQWKGHWRLTYGYEVASTVGGGNVQNRHRRGLIGHSDMMMYVLSHSKHAELSIKLTPVFCYSLASRRSCSSTRPDLVSHGVLCSYSKIFCGLADACMLKTKSLRSVATRLLCAQPFSASLALNLY